MECERFRERLLDYLDDASSAEVEAVRQHIERCEACAAELKRLSKANALVRDRFVPTSTEATLRETVGRVKVEMKTWQTASVARAMAFALPWRIAMAAAAAVLLVLGIWLFGLREKPVSPMGPDAPMAEADFVEKLLSANLTLSDAKTPEERAKIFNEMARCFYDDLVGAVNVADSSEAAFAVDNFETLVRDGVMPNARLLRGEKHGPVLTVLKSAFADYAGGAQALAGRCGRDIEESVKRLVAVAQSVQEDTEGILRGT